MGFASFKSNQFYDRILLFITDPNRRPYAHYLQAVPLAGVLGFTFIQFLCWAIIFGVTSSRTPAAVSFPMFILLLVPLRLWLIPRICFFQRKWLEYLDADSVVDHITDELQDAEEEEEEEEDEEEQEEEEEEQEEEQEEEGREEDEEHDDDGGDEKTESDSEQDMKELSDDSAETRWGDDEEPRETSHDVQVLLHSTKDVYLQHGGADVVV